ncbi:cupin domain-containing protein [Saccharothrix syringae]|uniref:Cupin domain-containing protein n=1 Tax=Saccharothrix syringae TaxID=103733 RepID=A0A5Q0H221_SACSY|nr:cupin domain-containing protein [Saccharothrix syringae]QFZ20153.1 cupin domain-containing protein [Saccharothrix syringae]
MSRHDTTGRRQFHVDVAGEPARAQGVRRQVPVRALHSEVAPVRQLGAGVVRMPAGHHTKPHVHPRSEIVVHVCSGVAASLCGPELRPVPHRPGSVVWMPPGLPHVAVNLDDTDDLVAFEVRADPTFERDTTLCPDLDRPAEERVRRLRHDHPAAGRHR